MKLNELYNILKNSVSDSFYAPDRAGNPFIYIDNINLIIERNDEKEEDAYSWDYFFDTDKKLKNLLDGDKLVYEICQMKDFPETYENIKICTWDVKYAGELICQLEYILISNLSSLNMMIPLSLKPFDYEYNFCRVWNEKNSPNYYFNLESKLEIKDSTFENFLFNR